MAKKPLTPEQAEIKALKKAKKSENWTKFWAVVLAAVLTVGVVNLGKEAANKALSEIETTEQGGSNAGSTSTPTGGSATTTPGGATTTPGGTTTTPGGTNTPAADAGNAAEIEAAVKAINSATAAAAAKAYDWERHAKLDGGLTVLAGGKDATATLDKVIQMVAPEANVASVVGQFLDLSEKPMTAHVEAGQTEKITGMNQKEYKFLLKGTSLVASDVSDFKQDGNTYTLIIPDQTSPQKDNSNPLHHATNDFVTIKEVQEGVANGLGSFANLVTIEESSNVYYTGIKVIAEVKDGTLVKYRLEYLMDVNTLNLKALGSNITGSGKGTLYAEYKNFA